MKRFGIYSLLFLACTLSIPLFAMPKRSWAECTLESMTQEEKIGQLFMIAAYVDPEYARREIDNPNIISDIDTYITRYHVGGLAYVGPSEWMKQVNLTNHYQGMSKYPLLVAQDLEWGLSMRIKDGMRFPKNITLGALRDSELIYEMGKEVGRQAKLIGVHMNLSPVLDVNIEPENIAINIRSFGSSPELVGKMGCAMIRGLQDAGIIASAKHFPGLGDISVDPHLGLPASPHSRKRLYEVELAPFVQAIREGVLSIQTEHLLVPALEPDSKTPASLSPRIIDKLLKKELGFKGLVLSGALRMKALANNFSQDEIILNAIRAGSDMLLMPQDFLQAYGIIEQAVAQGRITQNEIDERVLKILQMKEKAGLHVQKVVRVPNAEELHTPFGRSLKASLYQQAVQLMRNSALPLSPFQRHSCAYVQLGDSSGSFFLDMLREQNTVDTYIFPIGKDNSEEEKRLFRDIGKYSLIVVAVYPVDPRRIEEIRLLKGLKLEEELKHFRVHGMTESLVRLAENLKRYEKKAVVAYFGNPFGLRFFDGFSTLIMAYENDPDCESAALNLLLPKPAS